MVDGCSGTAAILLLLVTKVTFLTKLLCSNHFFSIPKESSDLGACNPGFQD